MKPPALQVLARLLGGPDTAEQHMLRTWAVEICAEEQRPARERELIAYLVRASEGGGQVRGHRGSLKHLLWWLRDHAGSLYEPAVTRVLTAARGGTWPLDGAGEALRDDPLVGGLVRQSLAGERADDLARHLVWEDSPRGRVAWNRTTLNLSKLAFRRGAVWYAAVSSEGGCLMGARGMRIDGFPVMAGWTQPYGNLMRLIRAGGLEDEAMIRRWLQAERDPGG